jgi:tetratricopeptide (TPR) repeat protein
MKWNSYVLGLALAVGVVFAQSPVAAAQTTSRQDTEANKIFIDGRNALDDGNHAEAEKKFREALTKYPKADQSDRTAYYLIITLEKLRRFADARTEIQNFHKNYPASRWRQDVDERSLVLSGPIGSNVGFTDLAQWAKSEERMAIERSMSAERGSTALPQDASMDALILRQQIQRNANAGIEAARERLKADPSDPTVLANLGTIYLSKSPQALPFLLALSANEAASPNARTLGFFWAARYNPNKEEVARTMMDLLSQKGKEDLVSEALYRMTIEEHRAVLEKIVASSHPDKFAMIEKIYRGGSITLRSDLIEIVAKLTDPKAWAFISDAAQNDKELLVRRTATQVLARRNRAPGTENLVSPRAPAPVTRGGGPARLVSPPSVPGSQRSKLTEQVPVVPSPPR